VTAKLDLVLVRLDWMTTIELVSEVAVSIQQSPVPARMIFFLSGASLLGKQSRRGEASARTSLSYSLKKYT
jgi:hypothetical protein